MTQQRLEKSPQAKLDRPTRVVLMNAIAVYRNALMAKLGDRKDIELVLVEGADDLPRALEGAEVFIFNGSAYDDRIDDIVRKEGKHLRWLHSTSAGNEKLVDRGAPPGTTITRSGGHSAPVVAEHAVALLLALARGLGIAFENQQKRFGKRDRSGRRIGTTRSLVGRTAVVLGFGPIGEAIAHRLKALSMKVIAVNRSGAPQAAADATYPVSKLKEALAQATVLVVAAPGGDDTRRLVGAAELKALQPDGYVVNVGRGSVIDTAAIEAALREGVILGAALDVIDPEPLPEDHSIWDAPNLIITPHRGGGGDPNSAVRQAEAVVKNFERFRRGEPLEHILTTSVPG